MTINKVILASPPHTGSTPLLNLVHGFLMPDEPRHWCTERLIDKFMITKTHKLDIDEWMEKYPHYDMYFVMTERSDEKMNRLICDKDKKRYNALVINYNDILVTEKNPLDNIIENMYSLFMNFFPKEIIPNNNKYQIKRDMLIRFNAMNSCVEKLKDEPFHVHEDFYGVHGGHRNREIDPNAYIFVSGDKKATKRKLEEYYKNKKKRIVTSED